MLVFIINNNNLPTNYLKKEVRMGKKKSAINWCCDLFDVGWSNSKESSFNVVVDILKTNSYPKTISGYFKILGGMLVQTIDK